MRAVERTIHHLIRNGFNSRDKGDDYAGLIYAAFQERATRITHGNVAKLAADQGEENLARICRKIAGDETRHEAFYTRVVGQMMERDPEGGVLAFRAMIKGIISMPGRLMFDGKDPDLFDHFAAVIAAHRGLHGPGLCRDHRALNEAWGVGASVALGEGGQGPGLPLSAAGTL